MLNKIQTKIQIKIRTTKFWIALITILLLCTLPGIVLFFSESESMTAEIIFQGEAIEQIALDCVTESYTITVAGKIGNTSISVEPGHIRVLASDCPDQICVNHGWLKSEAAPIVCLPNELVIRLLPQKTGSGHFFETDATEIDGISK